MTPEQIKHLVDRFLGWRLPQNFTPDAGISFKAEFNENTPWPMKHEPMGTNLLDATQAEAMVRHMLEGMPSGEGALRDAWNELHCCDDINLDRSLAEGIGELQADREQLRERVQKAEGALRVLADDERLDCGVRNFAMAAVPAVPAVAS